MNRAAPRRAPCGPGLRGSAPLPRRAPRPRLRAPGPRGRPCDVYVRARAGAAALSARRRGLSCVVLFYCAPQCCYYSTQRALRSNATANAIATAKTLQTHQAPHFTPELSRFLTALQLFLGALAVHTGTELLVLHVPRVPANDGRPPLSSARPC